MNRFTELSIKLANQEDYLDQLYNSVYSFNSDRIRDIDKESWTLIERYYKNNDNKGLIKELLKLPLFPVKDGYVAYLKYDPSAIDRNPETVNRICGRIREFGLDELYDKCRQPKETNRQMGQLFHRWISNGVLGLPMLEVSEFENSYGDALLIGTDMVLKEFANQKLGYKRNKGLDLVCRFHGRYVIGEAKFISAEGGHHDDQFEDALATINAEVNPEVIKVGILDGVLYIPSKRKMYTVITNNNLPVMSALLLRDFIYTIPK